MNLGQKYASVNDPNLYRRTANPNLMGMNTRFKNNTMSNRLSTTQYQQALQKNNVINNPGLKIELINKPHKLVLYKTFSAGTGTNTHTFTLNETLKDVVSVKLLKAHVIGLTADTNVDFFVLHIDELKKNYGDNGTSDKLKDSFAIIDLNHISNPGTETNYYENTFACNEDIKYFDPPLNSLNKLTCTLYNDATTSVWGGASQLKLEFIVETKEKLRTY